MSKRKHGVDPSRPESGPQNLFSPFRLVTKKRPSTTTSALEGKPPATPDFNVEPSPLRRADGNGRLFISAEVTQQPLAFNIEIGGGGGEMKT